MNCVHVVDQHCSLQLIQAGLRSLPVGIVPAGERCGQEDTTRRSCSPGLCCGAQGLCAVSVSAAALPCPALPCPALLQPTWPLTHLAASTPPSLQACYQPGCQQAFTRQLGLCAIPSDPPLPEQPQPASPAAEPQQ